MKREEIRIGMKVVPFKKTTEGYKRGLAYSAVWRWAKGIDQPFLYVVRKPAKDDYAEYLLNLTESPDNGDYFHSTDFKRYQPKPKRRSECGLKRA